MEKEIKVGDFITIAKWTSHQDASYCGDVLEVKAISLPFVATRNLSPCFISNLTIDLRRVEIQHLTREFVSATVDVGLLGWDEILEEKE